MLLSSSNTAGTTTRSTRQSSKAQASLIQDENKLIMGKGEKKVNGAVKHSTRGVLQDISNNIVSKAAAPKSKAEKLVSSAIVPVAAGVKSRVPIFPNKPTEKQVTTSKPPLQPQALAQAQVQTQAHLVTKPLVRESSSSLTVLEVHGAAAEHSKHSIKDKTMVDPFASAYQEQDSEDDGGDEDEAQPDHMLIDLTSEPIEDIDANDRHDPQCCTEYVNEIFEYCHMREMIDRVRPDYMSDQVDINERMRAILVDWMVEVHVKFKLLTETMFLSVSLVDRYLSVKPITRTKLQLVGITAMLLASKYEEIYSPEVRDFIHIADNAYNRDEVLRMERHVLTTLEFNLSASTPLHFLRRFSKASKSDSRTHTLSKYLSELTLTEYGMLKYLPSQIAAASVYIARCMTGRTAWNTTLEHYSQFRVEDFLDCAKDLNNVLKKALMVGYKLEHSDKPPQGLIYAVYKKYSSERLLSVARMNAVEI